jgi:hypothetical protein
LAQAYFGIIWFENFGSDKKRTVINKLISSLSSVLIVWNVTVQLITTVRNKCYSTTLTQGTLTEGEGSLRLTSLMAPQH